MGVGADGGINPYIGLTSFGIRAAKKHSCFILKVWTISFAVLALQGLLLAQDAIIEINRSTALSLVCYLCDTVLASLIQ